MPQYGFNAKVYRLSTGSRASWGAADSNGLASGPAPANLDEITQIHGDCTVALTPREADVTTRGNAGWGAVLNTVKDLSIDFSMVYDPADTDFLAIIKAVLTNANIAIAVLDGAKTTVGVQGMWADFQISGPTESQNIDGAQIVTFTAKPALTSVPPERVKVTA